MVEGVRASGKKGCSNQSDFVLMSVTAVPEPGTVAFMLAELAVVGGAARRRAPLPQGAAA